MVQLEYSRQNLLRYSAGQHPLPTYHLQYPSMWSFKQFLFFCLSGTFNSGDKRLVFIASLVSSVGETVYPMVIATHPWKPNQIAVGMSDGAVLVLEPLDTDDIQVGSDVTSEQRPSRDVSSSRLS